MLNCPLCGSEHLDGTEVCECGYRFAGNGPALSAEATTTPAAPQANLTIPGWLMSLAGIALAIYAYAVFDPSVEAPFDPDRLGSVGSRIINNGLLQDQLMLFMAGCSMLISGVVMLSAGALLEARR